tara:strand:- start:764 stop:1765 length:1002 start_codon:yes stop_codon:yes gene_type:complete
MSYRHVIFLPNDFFKKKIIFKSKKITLVKRLRRQGILVFSDVAKHNAISQLLIKTSTRCINPTFDGNLFPETGILYTLLCGNTYCNFSNYQRLRSEKERDLLFLIAGYLGAKSIKCIAPKQEEYFNIGDTILFEKTWVDLKYTLNSLLEMSNEINKLFFSECSRLLMFTQRRYQLQPNQSTYILPYETNLSPIVSDYKTLKLLNKYGINANCNKNTKMQIYEIEFFPLNELRYHKNKRHVYKKDLFVKLRHDYINGLKFAKDLGHTDISEITRKIFKAVCHLAKINGVYPTFSEWLECDKNKESLMKSCHLINNKADAKKLIDDTLNKFGINV